MKELSRGIILEAIKKIKNEPSLRNGRESTNYDLIYEGNAYPPILVLSVANELAGGSELTLADFGNNTEKAFSLLDDYSFEVKDKSYLYQLHKFFQRVEEERLQHADFSNSYKNLDVRVSFGAGNLARIPWIAFLRDGQHVTNGIYPVYLFYKEYNLLILAYGVSETNTPLVNWGVENATTISEYFDSNNLGTPDRYGASFVFKVYDMNSQQIDYSFQNDLDHILNEYKQLTLFQPPILEELKINKFCSDSKISGLIISDELVVRFINSLFSKPFLILTGLSGSGKTKIAQAFSKWICESDTQYKLIPVGADWTTREPLLGYPNALQDDKYVLPESGALQLILEARDNPDLPFFLILDEMNLSHVERYFADFLSAMESKEDILLHSGDEEWGGVPPTLKIPKNLSIIGTVNIDETTYMFSPKVLDRANVIEFRVSENEMESYLDSSGTVKLEALEGKGAEMAQSFVKIATNPVEEFADQEKLNKELLKFFNELKTVGAEFGYRSAAEIRRFAGISSQLVPEWGFDDIMDAAISQKLLPKLHGSRRKLEKVLYRLGDLCYPDLEKGCADLFKNHENITPELSTKAKYPISFEKITRMHKGLVDNGFTSFAEA